MTLSADPGVATAVILVGHARDDSFAWAAASTYMAAPATGSADDETVAYLSALEALLDHAEHVGRRLVLDLEDTPGGKTLAEFIADHLPHLPVTMRPDIPDDSGRPFQEVRDAVAARLDAATLADTTPEPRKPVRVVGATNASRRTGSPEAGWAWTTGEGRWAAGTLPSQKVLAVEVIAILRLVAAHPKADVIHIGSDSKGAIAIVHQLRTGTLGVNTAMRSLNLHGRRPLIFFDTLVNHNAEITFQWVQANQGHILNETADRLAVQARRAAQSGMSEDALATIQANIVDDLHEQLKTPRRRFSDKKQS